MAFRKKVEQNASNMSQEQINAEIKKLENASKRSRRNFLISLGVTAVFAALFAATAFSWGGAWFAINFAFSLAVSGGLASTIITGIIDRKNRYQAKLYKSKLIKNKEVVEKKSRFRNKTRQISQQTQMKNNEKFNKYWGKERKRNKRLTKVQQDWLTQPTVQPELEDEKIDKIYTPKQIFDNVAEINVNNKEKIKSKEFLDPKKEFAYFQLKFKGNGGDEVLSEKIGVESKLQSVMLQHSIYEQARYANESCFPLDIIRVKGEEGKSFDEYNKEKPEVIRLNSKEDVINKYNAEKEKYESKINEIFGIQQSEEAQPQA